MYVIDIEEEAQKTNSGILEIKGDLNVVQIKGNTGRILYTGSNGCIYLGNEPQLPTGEQTRLHDAFSQTVELVELLIILLIIFVIIKIGDLGY